MPFSTSNSSIIHIMKQWVIPCLLVLLIVIFQSFPSLVEQHYSTQLFVQISILLRTITAWLPISIGDIIYLILIIQVLFWIYKFIQSLILKKINKIFLIHFFSTFIRTILWIFIVFNILWGLNYSRLGIAHQLKIDKQTYSKEEVKELVCSLIDKVNTTRKLIGNDTLPNLNFKNIFQESAQLYNTIDSVYPFLNYRTPSIKKSLLSSVSHYVGFTGYYNPFTGEAQLSTHVPTIIVPYVTCHEIAHQLGYASEDDANFVGYLACSKSKNLYFQYSVYLDLHKYAAMELFLMDTNETHGWQLDSLVRKDLRNIRLFFNQQQNEISPLMNQIYAQYLKANHQSKGLSSYNDVVGLLIAFKKKYGSI